ncbi:PKD domain-containing protein [Mucilaginibacter gracilis]|uniref:PKD domain-containing protein n=1 Tax=Mucilaginibacter gracilis TaxID=423350 RepID=A0A495IXD6_9SPHI|nr:PKD domain-containing protein [Mucilaginibacter gracilis]RKR80714.1 PKD domain-containing protein [Mucilaginibacter gracilis]
MKIKSFFKHLYRQKNILLFMVFLFQQVALQAQTNIDFESGSLSNWLFFVGGIGGSYGPGVVGTPTATPAIPGRHTLTTGAGVDPYGGFSIVDQGFTAEPTFPSCNTHKFSLMLGNDGSGAEAERARYIVHVPAGMNSYHLYYRYALVFQDIYMGDIAHTGSGKPPQLTVSVSDSITGAHIGCADTVYHYNLTDYLTSPVAGPPGLPICQVGYKGWATTSIDLSGQAGKTIAIDFSTNDCEASSHFGYAYIDFVTICSTVQHPCYPGFVGTLHAPSGFATYTWYKPGWGTPVATGQTPTPAIASPAVTSVYAVVGAPASASGCRDTFYFTIDPIVPAITGNLTLCPLSTTLLTGSGTGTWSSSNTTVASVAASSGYVGASSTPGMDTITYTMSPSGCTASVVVTVIPTDISGPTTVCIGGTITLADATPGGTWLSGTPANATITLTTGKVSGLVAGTTNITYTTSTGCTAYYIVTVLPVPTFSGVPKFCVGYPYYQPHTGTGTWSSSNPAVASIVNPVTGGILGVAMGTATITYGTTSCYITEIVTIDPNPSPIIGTAHLCLGDTVTLHDTTAGGGWSSLPETVVSVDGGFVTALAVGTATINYYMPGTLCYVSIVATVDPVPGPITGPTSVCKGSTITLVPPFTGGVWSSLNTAVATVSTGGAVFGVAPGTATIKYVGSAACGPFTRTLVVTVMPVPAAITGPHTVCPHDHILLLDSVASGIWSVSDGSIATITAGDVLGVSAGPVTVTYKLTNGCFVTYPVTVNPLPAPITGPTNVCVGSTITLSSGPGGGTWSSSNTTIASVGSLSGIVNGIGAGPVTITYTLSTGCKATYAITVNLTPAPITGPSTVCQGATITLSDTSSGGTWATVSGNATVGSSSGVVTGISGGTALISYVTTGSCVTTKLITVSPVPAPVTPAPVSLCAGDSLTMHDATAGGTWSSTGPAGTINSATGFVTGLASGTMIVRYTLPTGCYITGTVNVNPLPLPIPGPDSVCVGQTLVLTDGVSGGTWSSSTTAVATVGSNTGKVLGIIGGTTTITYTLATGCRATTVVTVKPLPVVLPIICPSVLCLDSSFVLFDSTGGGQWSSSDPTIAAVSITVGTGVAVLSGISEGVITVSYTVSNDCGKTIVTKKITVSGPPVVAPITGILGVCSGFTDTLHETTVGGVWSSSNPAIASISTGGVVSGIASGSVTISYKVTTPCGTAVATVNVLVNMEPYITANSVVACQNLVDSVNLLAHIISEGGPCILVCDSSVIMYYANGVVGSSYTWHVNGGIVLADYGDSLLVKWQTVGLVGSITLHDTFSHCIDSAYACIRVIAKPHAEFYTSTNHYCNGDNIEFIDLSTGDASSSLTGYHWNFGDGHGSTAPGSAEHSYTAGGTYTVTLTVKNECNCTDSFHYVLHIDSNQGPDIQCPAIVCAGESAHYHSNASCATYLWSVTGGTITAGAGTADVTILWNNPDSAGFGYVSLVTPGCSLLCSAPTTIKVPVILQSAQLKGPHTLCVGKDYEFGLPLWPATSYNWGVVGEPGAIPGCHNDHTVALHFSTPGTKIIHGWYQNRIKLCGGNVFDTVNVVPASAITGLTLVCADTAVVETYSVAGGYSADWRLKTSTGSLLTTASGTTFSHSFGTPGIYLLCASGDFCADTLTINVLPLPKAIDSITGQHIVCLNRTYTYKAWNDVGTTVYSWEAVGGVVTPASGSSVVTVIWTDPGVKQLKVRHVSMTTPYCEGSQYVLNINQEMITPNVTGDVVPCANSYRNYNSNYTRAESYDWAIFPNTAGSVVNGNYKDSVKILWNNTTVPVTANIVVTVHKCDTAVNDTLTVTVQPSLGASIASSTTIACPGAPVLFTAAAGGSSYLWDFGDGSSATTLSDTITHLFPANTTTGNIGYIVKVTILPDPLSPCPIAGTAQLTETIKPGPVAYLSTGTYTICSGDTLILEGTVTSNVTGLVYSWGFSAGASGYTSGSPATLYALTSGGYVFTVTASNGCSATSNNLFLNTGTDCGGFVATCALPVHSSHSCNTITVTAGAGCAGTWTAGTPPLFPFTGGLSELATYDVPGIYWFNFSGTYTSCSSTHDSTIADTVMIVPDFKYTIRCGVSGFDTLKLMDHTAYLPFVTLGTINWFIGSTFIGSGANLNVNLPGPSTDTIKEVVNYIVPGGSSFSCSKTHIVRIPGQPVASFKDTLSPVCEKVPVQFTSLSTGAIVSYSWDFGDTSGVLIQNPQRTYTWPGISNPFHFGVKLTVTDSIGCTDDTTQQVDIYHDLMGGIMAVGDVVCPDGIPYAVNFGATGTGTIPYSYVWSTGALTSIPTIGVSTSGAYWVTVTDAHECRFVPIVAENVKVLNVPPAIIYGVQHYCIGETVQLYGYAGTGVGYRWYRNGALISTAQEVNDPGLPVGHYGYKLVITVTDSLTGDTCSNVSDIDSVRIYDLPAPPTISGPFVLDCNQYSLRLVALEPVSGTYNWSNGVDGQTDTVDYGGPYRVWFTDLHGCINHSDVVVPKASDYYFGYFPAGCYNLCSEQLPLTLYGPPCVPFTSWGWINGGAVVLGGTGDMLPYTITGPGDYQWALNNGLCPKVSDHMNVSTVHCDHCQLEDLAGTLICDTTNPASFQIAITFSSPEAGTTYVLGTDFGPIAPFSGTLGSIGFSSTLTFTTLVTSPLPDSITLELTLTRPNGDKCFEHIKIPMPACHWTAEKTTGIHGSNIAPLDNHSLISSALMVYPNPSSGEVNVSYDFGSEGSNRRLLAVYDVMGRKMNYSIPQEIHGNWKLNTADWTPGNYIIRMEGDGRPLHTQQIVIVH